MEHESVPTELDATGPLAAGTAKVDITPPVGHPLWGYARRHDAPSTHVQDRLFARAVVLAVGEAKLSLVSLDLGRPPIAASFHAIRERVAAVAGVNQVLLVATHTHHGPVVEPYVGPGGTASYLRRLEDRIVHAITQAVDNLQPARLGVQTVDVDLNYNRHARTVTPRDSTLTVIRLEGLAGHPVAHLVNYAAHSTLMPAHGRMISADFPGVMAQVVEEAVGSHCLFLQGAVGDLEPFLRGSASPDAVSYGMALGRAVIAAASDIRCDTTDANHLMVREHVFTFGKRVDVTRRWIHALYAQAFFSELADFYVGQLRHAIRPRLITVCLGGLGMVGVSGEFFCHHAIRLRQRARLEGLLFLGCCNDYHQYFPTKEAAATGGYGADAMVSPVEIGAGELMMDVAFEDLQAMGAEAAVMASTNC